MPPTEPIPQTPESPKDREARSRGRAYGVAMELAGSIIGMALIGWLIDRWQGTSPLWTLILTGLGAVGGFYNFLKKAMALNKEEAAAYKAAHPRRSLPPTKGGTASLFERHEADPDPDDPPDFKLPTDLEDRLERRAEAWKRRAKDDPND